ENKTWILVDLPKGQNTVKNKWVFKLKRDSSGNVERFKARLVAKGFTQRFEVDYSETFAPVVRHSTLILLLALAVEKNLAISHLDVTTAFLNGDLVETIFTKQLRSQG